MSRAWRAIVLERRLPYQVQTRWDPIAKRLGLTDKIIRSGGQRIRVRRLTTDEIFVANVMDKAEYAGEGFSIRPGDTVIDVGANIGTFALFAARSAARVIAIEPEAENYRRLCGNLALNSASNVTPIRAAVAGRQGVVTLECASEGGYHSTTSGIARPQSVQTQTVDALTLPDIFERYQISRCQFLKLDCEGAEHEILKMLPTQIFDRIDRIAMEWHGGEERQERWRMAGDLAERLESEGFSLDTYVEYEGFCCGMIRARRSSRD